MMARQTRYYVQVFDHDKRGKKLVQSSIRDFKTATEAERKGAYEAERHVGVLVYSLDVDADANDWGDPVMLARYGEVPEEAAA